MLRIPLLQRLADLAVRGWLVVAVLLLAGLLVDLSTGFSLGRKIEPLLPDDAPHRAAAVDGVEGFANKWRVVWGDSWKERREARGFGISQKRCPKRTGCRYVVVRPEAGAYVVSKPRTYRARKRDRDRARSRRSRSSRR